MCENILLLCFWFIEVNPQPVNTPPCFLRNLRHTFLLGSLSKSSVSSSSASSMSIFALWLTAAGRFERVSSDNEGGGGPVFEGPGAILVSMAIRNESMSSFMKSSGGGGAVLCALRGGADGLECKSDRKMTHKINKSFSCSFWPSWWPFGFLDLQNNNKSTWLTSFNFRAQCHNNSAYGILVFPLT